MNLNPIRLAISTLSQRIIAHRSPVSGKTMGGLDRVMALADGSVIKKKTATWWLPAAALTALVATLLPQTAAANISWGTQTTVSGDTDVATNGTLLYAYTGGNAGAAVNGETFAAGNSGTAWGANVTLTGFGSSYSSFGGGSSSPWSGLSTGYQTVLQGGSYGGASAATVTLNNLTVGHSYSVQIWVNDSRSGITGRTETTGGAGNAITLTYNNDNSLGGVGEYSIGYFVATATTQAFTLTPSASGSVQLNAISVRDNGSATKVWAGSSSVYWGTAANWTPANVPDLADTVLFNSTSTNLSTMLDANYTLATLALSNCTAPVSIGSDGNTLTLNGGINVLGTSQSLTVNDALVLGASQTWTVTNSDVVSVVGGLSGSAALTVTGGGTVSLTSTASYTGNTTINGGTLSLGSAGYLGSTKIAVNSGGTLALSYGGYLTGYPNIILAGGGTFDVSADSGYGLSGSILTNSSVGGVVNGAIDCSSGNIGLVYDGVNPSLIITNGTMNLGNGMVFTVENIGTVLEVGTYTIIAAATNGNAGSVGGSLPTPVITGNGAVGTVSLQLDSAGDLQLVVGSVDVWTGASDNFWTTAGNWTPADGGPDVNAGNSVLFNSSSTANLSAVLNDTIYVYGVTVVNPAGPVTIGGANTLNVYGNGINLSIANQNLTITAPVSLQSDQNWSVTNNRTLSISGGVSGNGGPTILGGGKVSLNSAATYVDTTTVASGGILQMAGANYLPNGSGTGDLNVNGLLDFNGNNEAINALNGSGIVDNTGTGAVTLTLGNSGSSGNFSGTIQNTGGSLSLVQVGGGQSLLGVNTYTGGTTVTGGNITPKNGNSFGYGAVTLNAGSTLYAVYGGSYSSVFVTNAITLSGGTLRVGGGSARQWGYSGPITVTTNSTIFCDGGTGYSGYPYNYAAAQFINGPVSLGAGNTLTCYGGNYGISIGGSITGTNDTIVDTGSYLWLAASNSFAGTIHASAGLISLYNTYAAQNATLDLSNSADTGTYYNYVGNCIIGGLAGVNNFNLNAVAQIGNNNISTVYGGAMTNTGSLIKIGTGTLTLTGANTYTGSTTVNGGTLALSGSGSVASTNITVASGATLDVTGASTPLTLGSGYTLANSTVGAILKGTNNLSGATLSLVYDGVHPAFTQTNGGMTLSASTTVTINNVYAPLSGGTYKIIAASTTGNPGKVWGTLPTTFSVTGNGALGTATLQIDGTGNLNLVISGSPQSWTGSTSTSWYTAANWLTGVIPGVGSNAIFNISSTNNLATVLNTNFYLSTLTLVNPAGPVSISGTNTLAITNGINMNFANQPLTITAPVALGASQTWTVTNAAALGAGSNNLSLSGGISGAATLTVAGGGRVVLSGTNTYSTGTRIIGGTTLQINNASAMPASGEIAVNNSTTTGTIDMDGLTLTNAGYVAFPYTSTTTLTNGTIVCNSGNPGFPGVSQVDYNWIGTVNLAPNGNYISNQRLLIGYNYNGFGLTINGTGTNGTFTFGGDNNSSENYVGVNGHTGFLTINGGTVNFNNATYGTGNGYLNVGANNASSGGTVTVNGGSLNIGTWLNLGSLYSTHVGVNATTSSLTITNGSVTVGGGSDTANNGVLFLNGANGDNTANASVSTLTLNSGGTLTVAQIQAGNQGTKTINLNGGTIVAGSSAASLFLSAATNLTVNVQNGGVTINSGANNITVAAALVASGTGGLTKTGAGTLTLTNTDTYTGATTISAGELAEATGGSCSNSPITVASGATNGVQVLAANGSWVGGALTYSSGTTYADINFGGFSPSTTVAPLQVSQVTFNGTPTVILRNLGVVTNGVYPIISYGSRTGTAPTTFLSPSATGTISNDTTHNVLYAVVTQGNTLPVVWSAGSANWDIATSYNWKLTNGVTTSQYLDGAPVTFDDSAAGSTSLLVTNVATVSPASVTANLTNKNYTISGSAIAGAAKLTKSGSGTLTLLSADTYSGGTTVNGGRLVISNTVAPANTYNIGSGATLELTASTVNPLANTITFTNAGTLKLDGGGSGVINFSATGNDTVALAAGGLVQVSSNSTVTGSSGYHGIWSANLGSLTVDTGSTLNFVETGSSTAGTAAQFDALNGGGNITMGYLSYRTLSVGNANGSGTFSGKLADANTGNGSILYFQKNGTGTETLTGTNTYTGETVINAGIINVGSLATYASEATNGSPLGGRTAAQDTTSTIGLHFTGGTLQYTNTGLGAQTTDRYIRLKGGISNAATIDASGVTSADTIAFTQGGAPINFWDNTGTRSVTLTGSNLGNNVFGLNIPDYNNGSSATSLIKNGAGTWDMINTNNSAAGTTANNAYGGYTGGTTISGGTLGFATNALGASGTVQFTGNATLRWDSGNTQDLSSRLKINDGITATLDTGVNNVSLASALTVGSAKTGALTKVGSGTLTLAGANTFTGATTISAGTLVLTGSGSLASLNFVVAGGAKLDVSGLASAFTLGSTATLTNSSVGAALNGTNNCSVGTLSLVYDGTNPSFIQTNGGMTLSASTVVKVNNTGSPLAIGTHTIIAAATSGNHGKVTGPLPAVVVNGNGAAGTAALQVDGSGNLNLVVTSASLPNAVINQFTVAGGNLILQGTNGAASGTYSILTTTNVALPFSSWTTNKTGTFTAGGAFSNGIPVSAGPQQFFLIKQP